MINKKDINVLLFAILWLIITIWSALDGLILFVSIWGGVSIVSFANTVKQWNFYGLSWMFLVSFMASVITLSTTAVYLLAVMGYIAPLDVLPIYLSKFTSGYAGLLVYMGFQSKLLRQENKQIQEELRRINGDKF